MSMLFEITIPVKPRPQARPRFFVRQAGLRYFVGAYDPKQCKTFKEVVAWYAKLKAIEYNLKEPLGCPIAISLTFHMGKEKKGRSSYHTKKPDVDNLAKAVKDALRGIIYRDDSQIVEAHLYKLYGEPMIIITIKTLEV